RRDHCVGGVLPVARGHAGPRGGVVLQCGHLHHDRLRRSGAPGGLAAPRRRARADRHPDVRLVHRVLLRGRQSALRIFVCSDPNMSLSLKPSLNWLLVFIPVSLALEYAHVPPPVLFFSAALAIVPIASLIVHSTEQLATYTGDAIGGLLNATFGN